MEGFAEGAEADAVFFGFEDADGGLGGGEAFRGDVKVEGIALGGVTDDEGGVGPEAGEEEVAEGVVVAGNEDVTGLEDGGDVVAEAAGDAFAVEGVAYFGDGASGGFEHVPEDALAGAAGFGAEAVPAVLEEGAGMGAGLALDVGLFLIEEINDGGEVGVGAEGGDGGGVLVGETGGLEEAEDGEGVGGGAVDGVEGVFGDAEAGFGGVEEGADEGMAVEFGDGVAGGAHEDAAGGPSEGEGAEDVGSGEAAPAGGMLAEVAEGEVEGGAGVEVAGVEFADLFVFGGGEVSAGEGGEEGLAEGEDFGFAGEAGGGGEEGGADAVGDAGGGDGGGAGRFRGHGGEKRDGFTVDRGESGG